MRDDDLIETESRAVGQRVREEIARRRLSRQALADMAKISLSTLEKALAGTRPFTLATTLRIEAALGLVLRPSAAAAIAPAPGTAPESMGAYARSAVGWVEGRYLTLRPSFGTPNAVYACVTTVRWLDEQGHLAFAESERVDARFEQSGHVSMPNLSGYIYLVTNTLGQYRLMILARPNAQAILYGLLTTLQSGQGAQLIPATCPVALRKMAANETPATGLIAPGTAGHEAYRDILGRAIGEDFVRFHTLGAKHNGA